MKYSFDVKDVVAVDLLGNNYIQLLEENQNKGIHCQKDIQRGAGGYE